MDKPMFGFQFGYMDGPVPLGTSDRPDCPNFQESRAVRKLQDRMLADARATEERIGVDLGPHGPDDRYGPFTDASALNWIGWSARNWDPSVSAATYRELWRTSGPNGATALLVADGFSAAEVAELHEQWRRWHRLIKPCLDRAPGETDVERRRRECTAAGGAWNDATATCTAAVSRDEGMSTGAWVGLLALGAAVAAGIVYVATED